jgi:hypothetical protein
MLRPKTKSSTQSSSIRDACYSVWARGYGLVDSPKIESRPGNQISLKPTVAPDAKTAAHYYPANYWYAMLKLPGANEFPPTSHARASEFI